eukprot:scaffold13971_cov69-Phaeocystis_antarctica.AAC.2
MPPRPQAPSQGSKLIRHLLGEHVPRLGLLRRRAWGQPYHAAHIQLPPGGLRPHLPLSTPAPPPHPPTAALHPLGGAIPHSRPQSHRQLEPAWPPIRSQPAPDGPGGRHTTLCEPVARAARAEVIREPHGRLQPLCDQSHRARGGACRLRE